MFRVDRTICWTVALCMVACMGWAADQKSAPVQKPAASAKSVEPAAKKTEPDRFAVPEGTPQQLISYIKKLITEPPRDEQTREQTRKMRAAILTAANRILAGKPNEEEMEFGVQVKMNMIPPEELPAFAEELKKGGFGKFAREVEGFRLQMGLRSSLMDGRDAMKKAIVAAVKFLEQAPPQPADVSLAFLAGRLAELTGDDKLALETYQSLAKTFAASKDSRMAEFSKVLDGICRRLSLVGQEMKIEGKLLNGQPFQWSNFAGKVVLVDFWATWCEPCLAELPNLLNYYELYHGKGFEIVGISLDQRRADLEEFIKKNKIPWPIMFSDDSNNSTATYYGVLSVPMMILVGKDGRVVALNVRGPSLKKELEKLLGPVDAKDAPKNASSDQKKPVLQLKQKAAPEKP
ncbi:MAG: redoxin family protein [Planctomycetaceae bacterium]|nr:redoxin family protein [Planctomycetaceae bacterium]